MPEIQRRPLARSSSSSACASFGASTTSSEARQLRLEPVRGIARRAAGAQLLQHVLRLAPAEAHLASCAEQRLELVGVGHSCGFSGVPGRPFGKSSLNLRATASGTSSSTFPPKDAISFTPLEETKLYCGLAIT